jgi:hypothetical protein
VTREDIIGECAYAEGVAIALSQNAGEIEHPTRTYLVSPPEFQDVALMTAPLWGQPANMPITAAIHAWADALATPDRHRWSAAACGCLEWIGQLEPARDVYGVFLLAHADEDWPLHSEGLNIATDLIDRVQWISWATFTHVRREILRFQRTAGGQLANGPRGGG